MITANGVTRAIIRQYLLNSIGDEGSAEVYSVVNGKKTDAFIHEAWMEDVEESGEYRMTSYNSAINCGISKRDDVPTKQLDTASPKRMGFRVNCRADGLKSIEER